MERSLSLTEGHVHSTMLRFALPFLLANLLQALYGAADLLIVGQFSTPAQLSAVATGSQVPVSYTHLDVYKRQSLQSAIPPAKSIRPVGFAERVYFS